ncbi:hypothetical protein C8F01DRAFT_1153556 [Mycena amicta]|nr:hypothetical protein C8F01DRAFT_1153556 [Mycena amicta]
MIPAFLTPFAALPFSDLHSRYGFILVLPCPNHTHSSIQMLSSASPSPSPRPSAYDRHRDGPSASFFMHVDRELTNNARKNSDIESGGLAPSSSCHPSATDILDSHADSNACRRGIYMAHYRRWFPSSSGSVSAVHLPMTEKDLPAHGYPPSLLERRVQTGSWIAMSILLILSIYFLMRER